MITILMRGQDIYSNEDESKDDSVSEKFESQTSEDAYICEGELLMIHWTLNNQ